MAQKICRIAAAVALMAIGQACSYIPFVGDDDEPRRTREEEVETTRIYIPKGELQCQDDTGDDLKTTKARLEDDGIRVYASECGVITGRMEPALCGSLTLAINIHEIKESDVGQAELLGFAPVAGLKEKDLGYKSEPCDS